MPTTFTNVEIEMAFALRDQGKTTAQIRDAMHVSASELVRLFSKPRPPISVREDGINDTYHTAQQIEADRAARLWAERMPKERRRR